MEGAPALSANRAPAEVVIGGINPFPADSPHIWAISRREPEIARAYYAETIALCEENGFPTWLAAARFYHASTLAELGQLEQGIAEMETSIEDSRQRGVARRQYLRALLARSYATLGRCSTS